MLRTVPRIAVTSLVRHASLVEPSGFFRVVDLDARRVVSVSAVPESAHRAVDPNPRGGRRGAKGIGVWGRRLVVANAERLFVLDRDWTISAEITHRWFGGVHDILCAADGVWVTCADSELLAKASWDGKLIDVWSWREDRELVRSFGFRSLPRFEPDLDYRDPLTAQTGVWNAVHLNGVANDGDELLVSFGRIIPPGLVRKLRLKAGALRAERRLGFSLAARSAHAVARRRARRIAAQLWPVERLRDCTAAVLRIDAKPPWRPRVLLRSRADAGVPNHNLARDEELLVYNDTNAGRLVGRDLATGDTTALPIPGEPPFARGLAMLSRGVFLVGSQRPAAVHAVDLRERRLLWSLPIGGGELETVYALAIVPDDFDDAPSAVFGA